LVDLGAGAVLTLSANAMPDSGATVTVNGITPPVQISVRRQRTFVYVVVRAQNQQQMNNFTVEIQCRSCREIGDGELDMVAPQPGVYGSQMWLMLVLLVAQVVIGILNVVWLLPLWLATLHNFGAALLLCSVVMLKFMVTHPVGAGIGAGSTAAGVISASRSAGAAHA
jgi:hypothetical protein